VRSFVQAAATVRFITALSAALFVTGRAAEVHADSELERAPSVFSYTEDAPENRVRALLEIAGVYAGGYTFFLATNRLLPGFKVPYSWPVFRKKLLGEGLELDVNGLNTNFVGHPVGGSMYYTMARSNRLSIAESAAFAIAGSVLWELFGEIDEFISINDMIVTPLAGVAIAEPLLQLGAFFDRSSPALHNRILGALFAPIKALNDALDGYELARASVFDEHEFPVDEYHRFDLRTGAAATSQDAVAGGPHGARSFEYRLSLASYLVRLPGYDGAGRHELWFADGNVSNIELDAGVDGAGLIDLEVRTFVGMAGYYTRRAHAADGGGIRGHGTLLVWTVGYEYALHDYDRDRVWPRDRLSSVQPLGLMLEHRLAWDPLRVVMHVEGGLDFGGQRPYALPAYARRSDALVLPPLIADNRYCFVRGAHVLAAVSMTLALLELTGSVRYGGYEGIDMPVAIRDEMLALKARASVALGHSPARVSLLLVRRARRGSVGPAQAARADTMAGLELGARY
jgi:hypothetical protein